MPPDVVISARNLAKTYRLFGHPGDRIKQFLSLGLRRYHRDFTALKDVSFDIRKGETIGIIGRNGSGKSTLLQLVCGIFKPTDGTLSVNGRVSALLELGAGFNPEFTGRENAYFQGALMGLGRTQIDRRFDSIAAFADIGEFIDQPVRIYSSGMYLRLAFAVAAHVDSEILVVDEALAVGDAGFRARCYRRIGELRNAGCTILFVSHAMDQIVRLCSRVMLLDEGDLLLSGEPVSVVAQFQRLLNADSGKRAAVREQIRTQTPEPPCEGGSAAGTFGPAHPDDADAAMPYEPNGAVIDEVRLVDASGQSVNLVRSGQDYRCVFRIRFTRGAERVRCAMLIKTRDGMDLGGAMTAPSIDAGIPSVPEGAAAVAEFDFKCSLNPGSYRLNVAVFGSEAGVEYALHGIQGALGFRVEADEDRLAIGAVDFGCRSSVRLTGAAAA
ncbi:MAG: ABC transporter ATP-binding protein [Rhodocyclales bacterium]|nr:ABC transporter ATP-binding protein [Rhodocyclales bacterium]